MRDFEFELLDLIFRDEEGTDQEEIDESIFDEFEEVL